MKRRLIWKWPCICSGLLKYENEIERIKENNLFHIAQYDEQSL